MVALKTGDVDRYLKKPDPAHCLFLIYGPDAGLVSERARQLAKQSGVDLQDPFATVRLDADSAAADPARIADEAHTVSMFGGRRIIWISGSTQRKLINGVQPIIDLAPQDAWVIIEAGDLKKSAPLRSRIEKCPHAAALPCYQDQARALDEIIDQEMSAAQLTIAPQTRQLLKANLGSDRMASRGEVQKLALYAMGRAEVTPEDVEEIVGDASALAIDTVIDAASVGEVDLMEHTVKRLLAQGVDTTPVLLGMQRQFQQLHHMRARMDAQGQSAANVASSARPPLHFARKDKVVRALDQWPHAALSRALHRLDRVVLETRTNPGLAHALTTTALLAIALEARSRSRRRG